MKKGGRHPGCPRGSASTSEVVETLAAMGVVAGAMVLGVVMEAMVVGRVSVPSSSKSRGAELEVATRFTGWKVGSWGSGMGKGEGGGGGVSGGEVELARGE